MIGNHHRLAKSLIAAQKATVTAIQCHMDILAGQLEDHGQEIRVLTDENLNLKEKLGLIVLELEDERKSHGKTKAENQAQGILAEFQIESLRAELHELEQQKNVAQNLMNESEERFRVAQDELNKIKECSICIEGTSIYNTNVNIIFSDR